MATARPFSRNLGANIPGTVQIGQIAVGYPTAGFEATGLKWWNGPDEDLGYVIGTHDLTGRDGADGTPANIRFWRTNGKTDAALIELANAILGASYTTVAEAEAGLANAGLWSSYSENNGGNGGTNYNVGDYLFATSYTPAPGDGNITFPAHPITSGPGFGATNPNLVGSSDDSNSYQLFINSRDASGNDRSSVLDQLIGNAGTLTLTQGSNSVTYSFTNQAFRTGYPDTVGQELVYLYDSQFPVNGTTSPAGSLTVVSNATGDFNTIDPVTVAITIDNGNSGTPTSTKIYWTAGDPSQSGQFSASMQNQNNLMMATNFTVNQIGLDAAGTTTTNHASFITGLAAGTTLVVKSTQYPSNTATYEVTSTYSAGANTYNIAVTYVSGSGNVFVDLWEFEFIS